MSTYLSIDVGSAFVKAATHDQTIRFPSVLAEAPVGSCQLVVDGKGYIVGDAALEARNDSSILPHTGVQYHGSYAQRVLICEVLRRLGGGDYDCLVLNLPMFFADRKDQVRDFAKSVRKLVWQKPDGTESKSQFGSVRFVPQGSGAIWTVLGDAARRPEGPVDICSAVDIGGHTTDVVTVRPGESIGSDKFIYSASGSCGTNIAWFFERLSGRMQNLPGHNLIGAQFGFYETLAAVEKQKRTLRYRRETFDITRPLAATKREFTTRLMTAVEDIWGSFEQKIELIVLTGGGASLIDTEVWNDGRIVVLDSLANVTGQRFVHNEKAA